MGRHMMLAGAYACAVACASRVEQPFLAVLPLARAGYQQC